MSKPSLLNGIPLMSGIPDLGFMAKRASLMKFYRLINNSQYKEAVEMLQERTVSGSLKQSGLPHFFANICRTAMSEKWANNHFYELISMALDNDLLQATLKNDFRLDIERMNDPDGVLNYHDKSQASAIIIFDGISSTSRVLEMQYWNIQNRKKPNERFAIDDSTRERVNSFLGEHFEKALENSEFPERAKAEAVLRELGFPSAKVA